MSASLFRHVCRSANVTSFRQRLGASGNRYLRTTAPVLKKKASRANDDDLFTEDAFAAEEGDLFQDAKSSASSIQPTTPAARPSRTSTSEAGSVRKSSRRTQLSPEVKQRRFDKLLEFMEPRIGRNPNPTMSTPLIRNRSWMTALDLAETEADMLRILAMLPEFKESGRSLLHRFDVAFARRCDELKCSNVALKAFGDFAKYNVPLTLHSAQWLLLGLNNRPFTQTLMATALYEVYDLPPITSDLTSAALLAGTCLSPRNRSEDTLKIARALMPHIHEMFHAEKEKRKPLSAEEFELHRLKIKAIMRMQQFARSKCDVAIDFELPRRVDYPERVNTKQTTATA